MKKLTLEQLERMNPEAREKYKKDLKRVSRNRKILAGIIGFIIIAVLCATLSMTVLFNISTIKVAKAGSYYTEKDIISASGLDVGDNMLRTDFDSAADRIEQMLPYVLEAQIKKTASGNVTITVKDDTASLIFKAENGFAVADSEGKVLEILSEKPEKSSLIIFTAAKKLNAVPGESIGFEDSTEADIFNSLTAALKNADLYDKITGIDISKHSNIKVEYQGRMRIKLGDISDIDAKLEAASKTLEMENENNPNTIAEVNAVNPKKVYVNPLDSLDDVVGEKKEKRIHEEDITSEGVTEEASENSGEKEATEPEDEEDKEEEKTTDENTEEDGEEKTDEEEGNNGEENENEQ